MTIYTVAVQKPGASHLTAVGPTSETPSLLPLREASERYPVAIITTWEDRNITVRTAKRRIAKAKAEQAAAREFRDSEG